MIRAETTRTVNIPLPGGKTAWVSMWVEWIEEKDGVLILAFKPMNGPTVQIWRLALEKAEELRHDWEQEIHEDLMEWRLRVYV